MTLLLGLLNQSQAILVSDRRFTVDGRLVDLRDDERNKAAVFFCHDARMAVAFTGLARAGKFETSRAILEALLEAGALDHLVLPTIGRFASVMKEKIEKTQIPKPECRLTIVFAGYRFDGQGAHPETWQMTNWADSLGRGQVSANDKFVLWRAKNPLGLFGFGMCAGVRAEDRLVLRKMLTQAKPHTALVSKAVHTIRNASDSDKSKGLVGRQCDSIVIPADARKPVTADYHSSSASNISFLPSYVVSTKSASLSCQGGAIQGWDQMGNSRLQAWPSVGRNQPCPCGSGKKFKRCHGHAKHRRM